MTDQDFGKLGDGSIDQAFHARRARGMRSAAAYGLMAGARRAIRSLFRRSAGTPARKAAG